MTRLLWFAVLFVFLQHSMCVSQSNVRNALITKSETKKVTSVATSFQESKSLSYKSVTLAVISSTLVPGTGEIYAGDFESGKYPLIAEAAVWIAYAAFRTHGNWIRQDARLFATEHAGASFSSKNDQFDVDMGNYLSSGDYNQAKLRNREGNLLYTDRSYSWQWDSDANRVSFKNERIRSDGIYQNAKFVLAAAVVNRIYSAFAAGRATSAYNRKVLIEGAWNLDAFPTSTMRFADGINLRLSMSF
jgi:hypothetical protein